MERSLHNLETDIHTVTEWPLWDLHRTARELATEKKETEIPRQRDQADRLLGHVAFEMWARRHHDAPEEMILGTETGTPSSSVA